MSILELDRESLLVHVSGHVPFADVEAALVREGLTLGASASYDGTVGTWLEQGAKNARSAWLDPADHLIAGFSAHSRAGQRLSAFRIRPAPRRAVGPDLLSLVLGTRARFVVLESVWLRVHRLDTPRVKAAFASPDEGEPLNRDETALFDAIEEALR